MSLSSWSSRSYVLRDLRTMGCSYDKIYARWDVRTTRFTHDGIFVLQDLLMMRCSHKIYARWDVYSPALSLKVFSPMGYFRMGKDSSFSLRSFAEFLVAVLPNFWSQFCRIFGRSFAVFLVAIFPYFRFKI
ncbi:hypothetical protein POVWA2_030960 [Plasmodium ovale wallikeri]|uniref:Uncharacterized protein n=1 Tax=Plasmodium ovale wallikeri TaxID=864142 RepID=A0A1A8YYQ1_PLAOA|nr:hypothetical protein POVWA2_030960 [Plasmodium ovale wallikeri]